MISFPTRSQELWLGNLSGALQEAGSAASVTGSPINLFIIQEILVNQPHALIIDDNAKNMNVLARLLSEQGVSNTQVAHPRHLEAALETAGEVDIVFLDIEMPGMSGYDVLERLRLYDHLGGVPVVAYTVHVSEINRAHELGFHSFLGKPLDPDKFPSQLACILRGEPVWATV
jgi:two-component system cell cycle response regulator DivK